MGEFPTEKETWKAAEIIKKAFELGKEKLANKVEKAFNESDNMGEFLNCAATDIWCDARGSFAIAKKTGIGDEFIKTVIDSLDKESFKVKDLERLAFFLEILLNRAEWQVF